MSFLLDRSPSTLGESISITVFTKLLALVATLPMLFPAWFCACFKHEGNCCSHVQELPGRCCHHKKADSNSTNTHGEPCQHKTEHAPTCPSTKPANLLSQTTFCVDDSASLDMVGEAVTVCPPVEVYCFASRIGFHSSSPSERPLFLTLRALLI